MTGAHQVQKSFVNSSTYTHDDKVLLSKQHPSFTNLMQVQELVEQLSTDPFAALKGASRQVSGQCIRRISVVQAMLHVSLCRPS